MSKISQSLYRAMDKNSNKFLSLFLFLLFIIIFIFSLFSLKREAGYNLFIELNHSYGLKVGSNVNFKGVKVGYVDRISIQLNKVILLTHINSSDLLIPKQSFIEANQVGLFNDVIIDINPSKKIFNEFTQFSNVFSKDCLNSSFICANFYVKGYKGLNYDDLVRSTTRISQRFDDPRFFNLFYLFLQNTIDISDEIVFLVYYMSYFFYILGESIPVHLSKYIF
uniref:Mce/MlaD domain-containing protein n=1 Tax=Kuetzingia canaliculata TaxID=228262 RepID=A0A1Z1MPN4_KUECA|nr:hypothetical protein [Kuetzingia canaliculata]ARW67819.1 hypothetical protein [Kuetzingia canaliculata]